MKVSPLLGMLMAWGQELLDLQQPLVDGPN